MSVTIYDIAKRANVSPSTVSRALRDHPRIGAKTKQYIQELAREMGYIPSDVARSLTASRTWTIGMVMATTADPFMGRVVEGVEQVAVSAGFNVFISTSQNDRARELAAIETLHRRRVEGIIIIASHLIKRYWRHLDDIRVPVVVIDEQDVSDRIHFVTVDDKLGTQLAVEHLIGLGHRRIGYVSVTNRPKSNKCRLQGYQAALKAAGLSSDPDLIYNANDIDDHTERGKASLESLWAAGATAVFCYNDVTAIGLLAACFQHSLVVPDHLSIIGFDDIEMAAYTTPPLTTIRQPRFKMGQQAMQLMLELLDGQVPENRPIPGELVVRQSTAGLLPRRNLAF